MYQEVYERKSYRSLKSLAECILGMRFEWGTCFGYNRDIRQHGQKRCNRDDIEGFISYARSIDGVEVAHIFKGAGRWKNQS